MGVNDSREPCAGAVKITADARHVFMRDPPFQLENRAERRQRQRFEVRLLLGEGLIDDALSRGVHARIGYAIEPITQLDIQIVEIAEGAGEEEVLADVAIWPAFAKLSKEPAAGQARIRRCPFAQIPDEWINQPLARLARAIDRRLKASVRRESATKS